MPGPTSQLNLSSCETVFICLYCLNHESVICLGGSIEVIQSLWALRELELFVVAMHDETIVIFVVISHPIFLAYFRERQYVGDGIFMVVYRSDSCEVANTISDQASSTIGHDTNGIRLRTCADITKKFVVVEYVARRLVVMENPVAIDSWLVIELCEQEMHRSFVIFGVLLDGLLE